MSVNGVMTAAERQRWYWMKEVENCNKKMNSFPLDSPDYIQWKKQYDLACKIYRRLSETGEFHDD